MASGPGAFAQSAWPWALWDRVTHILNMAREIDNFYPERFTYHNVRLWDEESAQLLPHWKETYRFIEAARSAPISPARPAVASRSPQCPPPADSAIPSSPRGPCLLLYSQLLVSPLPALPHSRRVLHGEGRVLTLSCLHRAQGTRVLVHCKMGVSRSAATVLAYAMKQYGCSLEQALRHVQGLRPIARPNPGFLRQLQVYQGILTARADSEPPPHSRQSHVWEQKVGGVSPEEHPAPEVSTPFPPLLPEPGGGGEEKVVGVEESQAAPKEEPGPRPRINLRGVMRSISLLEPSLELESTSGASDMPEASHGFRILAPVQVFSSPESSHEEPPQPFLQLASTKGGQQVGGGPQPALKSRQSVVALQSAALVASRTQAFQEQRQGEPSISSTPRFRKVVRQASVDDSGEEGEA
ncbi:Protein phosphatase Slingshot 3 [Saguinus oedipus]|uniref:Protein phosphatase Slingshot 3 n=1 Tax=Saguinus oedipus TaxID=9490 RepID=A0ABQ9UTA9_SAGOE|nr:Protein phosphatase Slingshot 3 [Saguinus oedipus]